MIEAAKVISLIQRTPGYNDKQYLLKKNENVQGLKEILRFIYDPYNKTGISTAKLTKALMFAEAHGPYIMGEEPFISYTDMIKYLKRHNTGTDSDLVMAARFINCTKAMYAEVPFAAELAKAIVTQDLQIGVTSKTLNTVYGEHFIPITGCMLGTLLDKVPLSKVKWPCVVTEKLDGVRRILIKENGVSRLYSRSGHEDTGLVDIIADAEFLPDNRVYDGELLAIGQFEDNIAQRQATFSRSAGNRNKHGLAFNIFDMLPVEEFYNGISEDTAAVRKLLLGATLMDDSIQHLEGLEKNWPMLIASYGIHRELSFIKPVPILGFVKNLAEVEPLVEPIWARKGEGVMLNTADGLYEIKRSKSLLKVKFTEEITLQVVDVMEGSGKFEDMLGAFIVIYKGNHVGVSGRIPVSLRQQVWAHPEQYIGRSIEIDTFGESMNQQGFKSLNCPIFKRFVGDEE